MVRAGTIGNARVACSHCDFASSNPTQTLLHVALNGLTEWFTQTFAQKNAAQRRVLIHDRNADHQQYRHGNRWYRVGPVSKAMCRLRMRSSLHRLAPAWDWLMTWHSFSIQPSDESSETGSPCISMVSRGKLKCLWKPVSIS